MVDEKLEEDSFSVISCDREGCSKDDVQELPRKPFIRVSKHFFCTFFRQKSMKCARVVKAGTVGTSLHQIYVI